jgi:ubiquinone/menaquinone biosynthesis C-methylase UbiE
MATPADPRATYPTTYVVQEITQEEIQRLCEQDCMLTRGMGGVLPEQSDPARFGRVLDVGSGTGGWLVEMAKAYPGISVLCGAEANKRLLAHARSQAQVYQVSDRVTFQMMDVLRMIEFPTGSFDLVNQRLGTSFLRTWEWPKLLLEYQRLCRPGGILRITEADLHVRSNSPALEQFFALVVAALQRSGHLFTPSSRSVLDHLVPFLEQFQFQDIQTCPLVLTYRTNTPEWHAFVKDMQWLFQTITPFLRKWISMPEDYLEICQQALSDMHQPTFLGCIELLTVWGRWRTARRIKRENG